MKQHLFYTFLAIFVATAAVTLLGVTGAVRIADGYLTPLITAFLVELAGAVVAIFRRADFFTDDEQRHARTLERAEEAHRNTQERLVQTTSQNARLQDDLQRMNQETEGLRAELATLTSLRLRVLALLGAQSLDSPEIICRLGANADSASRQAVMSVIGALVQDGTIEAAERRPPGYYQLRKPQ